MISHPLRRATSGRRLTALPRRREGLKRAVSGTQNALWYAVHLPVLTLPPSPPGLAAARLEHIAQVLEAVSATVSLHAPDSLVFEAGSVLRYFGGIAPLRRRVHTLLEPLLQRWGLPVRFHEAVSPVPAASLLLASAGSNLLVQRREDLRAALGHLPLHRMALTPRQLRQLQNMGLFSLRDLWRLPTPELGRRFGKGFVQQLSQCLGKTPSAVRPFRPPPLFRERLDYEYGIDNTHHLLPGIAQLVTRLCHFLLIRESATTRLILELLHEQLPCTRVSVDLRQASREHGHLLLLLETRVNTLMLPAAVTGLRLSVSELQAFVGRTDSLSGITAALREAQDNADSLLPLLEQLQARLGNPAVRGLHCQDSHCPERAGVSLPLGERPATVQAGLSPQERPCWLLPAPLALPVEEGQLFYQGSLRLLSGPERIETQWWEREAICRDYYVARNRHGMHLWVFRERGERAMHDAWYLHGIFD